MEMGPWVMRNHVIVNFNRYIPIVLALINDIYDGDKNRTNCLLTSTDIAFVVSASTRRRQTFGVEASLELHFWVSGALPMPAFTIIINLSSLWTVWIYMVALYVTVKKTLALVPRKVDEAWGCVAGPFVTINKVAFLHH
jgi:hypothetical protein